MGTGGHEYGIKNVSVDAQLKLIPLNTGVPVPAQSTRAYAGIPAGAPMLEEAATTHNMDCASYFNDTEYYLSPS
ncbi:hypothetical protein GLOTRDRAFT_134190 [Gloeophyllum trabeum ATCC 11539]|uniref:Uncharacterized protein n=1 Tax=Gloeophyllum trabeum (strain ATCC 11539 / FP-39264 / Madison 617) TaxID=670483 RepID=S7PS17_GLOTA|nr:uncharacterized protein GLOTRDRAFT_134190 [Gloeophyllum trabeum ATCC 11539]EPQ50172.1 hypothetical protein GLOTRDRAFT_134190 [Gloeophyllum trabeum ATCC 11539]